MPVPETRPRTINDPASPVLFAFGIAATRSAASGAMIDCYFPVPLREPPGDLVRVIHEHFAPGVSAIAAGDLMAFLTAVSTQAPDAAAALEPCADLASESVPLHAVVLIEDVAITHTAEAYLKLHLLSHRLALPNTLNLGDIFTHLPNVAWTSEGAVAVAELPTAQRRARAAGRHLEVHAIDKFPRMSNYVVPSGVRIADASRIRLGAYLGEGTTVMHEGFINFNAAALGPNMVEGRISQGVIVGAHSDLGGSASTMGTLSGGGNIRITLGEHCLIGANAGTGIPLGDRCTIEAGLYITAGTRVRLIDADGQPVGDVKAREVAGANDLLFLRNGLTGQIECRTNKRAIELNALLHAND
ncbi:MAG: DapH/DapD/GlmU-related protein [Pseudomonadales bacterium]